MKWSPFLSNETLRLHNHWCVHYTFPHKSLLFLFDSNWILLISIIEERLCVCPIDLSREIFLSAFSFPLKNGAHTHIRHLNQVFKRMDFVLPSTEFSFFFCSVMINPTFQYEWTTQKIFPRWLMMLMKKNNQWEWTRNRVIWFLIFFFSPVEEKINGKWHHFSNVILLFCFPANSSTKNPKQTKIKNK